jgi:hypothetical protein
MTTLRAAGLALALVLTLAPAAPTAAAPPVFKAGFAERDVSPEVGMEQPGGYVKAYHRSFHDACKVRASVFDDGTTRVAVVGIDALFIRGKTVAAARKAIESRCGIKADHVLVSASHTHSGGPIGLFLPGEFDDADPLVKRLVSDNTVIADPKYLARVEAALADAVCAADAARVEARGAAMYGVEDKVAFNRRFRMANGRTFTHPGQGNPEIKDVAGPTDPQVGVLGVWDAKGAFLGCVVNFACHATTSPGGISADYIHYIEKTVRGLMGEKAVVVFLPGMAGDVTQVDNRSPYQIKQSGEVASRFVGGRVGAEAVKVLLALEQGAGPLGPVAARTTILKLPRRVPKPEKVAEARALVARDLKGVDATLWTFAKETVVLDARIKAEPVPPVEVQAVQVGPVVFLACPAEYFCEFGLRMKAESGFPVTFPVSMANDAIGYVPTAEALGPQGGGYETRLTSYSNLIPQAGDKIADTLIGLARGLKPGPTPTSARLPKFAGKPWSYGDVPAEVD